MEGLGIDGEGEWKTSDVHVRLDGCMMYSSPLHPDLLRWKWPLDRLSANILARAVWWERLRVSSSE